MNRLKLIVLVALALLLTLMANTGVVRAQGCGIEPPEVKPVTPVGCKDVYHACTCDNQGNCRWTWVCVPQS